MVSFILNGSEIMTYMEHTLPKAQNQSNIFKMATLFFQFQAADH